MKRDDAHVQALASRILDGLGAELEFIKEKAVAEATAEFHKKCREALGRQALCVSKFFDVTTDKANIVITVRDLTEVPSE